MKIIIFTGHTGAGKSTLAQSFSEIYGYKLLSFSKEGMLLANCMDNILKTLEIENEIYSNILLNTIKYERMIVDGVSSINVINRLLADGMHIVVVKVTTPYIMRIARICKQYHVGVIKSIRLEYEKEKNKSKSGLNSIMNMTDISLYNVGNENRNIKKLKNRFKEKGYFEK